jgi:hypothetical protein
MTSLLMENVTFHIRDMGLDRSKTMLKKYQFQKNRVRTEDLTVVQLTKKYSALYETQKLISIIMILHHCSLSLDMYICCAKVLVVVVLVAAIQ